MYRIALPICLAFAIAACQPAAEEPPFNVVFILIDDMGWTDAAAFGSTFYQTPNIDRLASESMRFTNGYAACPVCSPTRASILTGKYPARLRQTDWIPGRGNQPDQQLLQVEDLDYLDLQHETLADILKRAGYTTAHIGKWHLGGDEYLPQHRGFDINIAGNDRGSPPSYYYPYSRPDWQDTTQVYQLAGLLDGGHEGEYLTDRLGEEAAGFIASHQNEPFFLYFAQYAVHTPLQSRPDLEAKYNALSPSLPDSVVFDHEGSRPVRVVQNHAIYAGMVESMDNSVGSILAALEENGLDDRTIVIFFSDNGGLSTSEGWPTANAPLRTGKGWLYEGGIRVPMLVKWPGVTDTRRLCDVPASSVDFVPTILDMLGLTGATPAETDGVSLVTTLRDPSASVRDTLYWHYPHYSNQGGRPGGAIRAGNLKLIEHYEDGSVELFDLETDLEEQHDLAGEQPEKAEELRRRLAGWRASVNAQMPAPNPGFASQ